MKLLEPLENKLGYLKAASACKNLDSALVIIQPDLAEAISIYWRVKVGEPFERVEQSGEHVFARIALQGRNTRLGQERLRARIEREQAN